MKTAIKVVKYWMLDRKEALSVAEKYTGSPNTKWCLLNDMFVARAKQRISFDEFFLYKFPEKTREERKEFISDDEHFSYLSILNNKETSKVFTDKGLAYEVFKEFYKRDAACVRDGAVTSSVRAFMKEHDRFIVKPLKDAFGNGIEIIENDTGKVDEIIESLSQKYNGNYIVEDLIRQSESMARFHESSVNTLRISTLRLNDRVEILWPFAKFGLGNAVVDNAASGGVLCPVDIDTGRIYRWAIDEKGNKYDAHPDSGIQFEGFVIPKWNYAIDLAKKLALVLPENRWIGWDVALTDKGWVMVEGNAYGQFIGMQLMLNKGIRSELDALVAQL